MLIIYLLSVTLLLVNGVSGVDMEFLSQREHKPSEERVWDYVTGFGKMRSAIKFVTLRWIQRFSESRGRSKRVVSGVLLSGRVSKLLQREGSCNRLNFGWVMPMQSWSLTSHHT